MRSTLRKIGIQAAVLVTVAGGFTAATVATMAGPAAASSCSWYSTNVDPKTSTVIHPVSGYSGIAMRTGIYQSCDLVTRVPWGKTVSLDCFANGGDTINGVSTWSHVHYGSYSGWISDYYLSGDGSTFNCTA